uniref:Transducin beta like 3 n=1 Tax=Podarcis muralis TaxID=64176 RepID=A0A670JVB8_PODMU
MDATLNGILCFSTNYAISKRIEPFYKGGRVQMTHDGEYMFCACDNKVNVVDVATGTVVNYHCVVLFTSQSVSTISSCYFPPSSMASMAFDSSSTLLATGGCDSAIKVWDVPRQYCTHNLKGSTGVVHLVEFHPDTSKLQLFSSSMDNTIRVWDLKSSECVAQLENHYSSVTSLAFSPDNETLISSGRDKICTVWDLNKGEAKGTIPVYESIESVVMLPEQGDFSCLGVSKESLHFVTAGSKGILRVWDAASATCVHSQSLPCLPAACVDQEDGLQSLMHCVLVPMKSQIVTVNSERNICMYDAQTLELRKQFAGNNGEVLDVRFLGPRDSHVVVATNSPQLKVFELVTSNCQILHGHTDIVLALDVFRKGRLFASCAKDKSIRIWRMNDHGNVFCVAQGLGHMQGVGALSCSRMKENFVVTASKDNTMKVWSIPEYITAREPTRMQHQKTSLCFFVKDVNSVAVSPNDKLIATASQDKTAKLWTSDNCEQLGTFVGHKRGVWCVQFSPVDRILATSSADGTVKLWSLQDFSCLKTFEGHEAPVLKIIFVSGGGQVLSSGADGLMKLWTINNNVCVKTFDAHDDKVLGLHANRRDNALVTGSADSRVLLWKDVTQTELEEEQVKQEEQILKEQKLSNLLHKKKYLKALGLAISLDRPHTVLSVIKAILKEANGKEDLEKNLLKLRKDQKEAVLKFSITWNTNSRNYLEAQAVVETLLKHETPESLLQYEGIKAAVESLLPYTERHFQRLGRLLQASMFLDFMWQNMKLPDAATWDEEMDT